jgi:hypothetical protein
MLLRALRVALLTLLVAPAPLAQLSRPGRPPSLRRPRLLPELAPAQVLPAPDVARLMQEDEARNHWPARYGAVIPTAFSCDDVGVWEELPTGELVWRLRLLSPGAYSLGVLFDRYELPPSGELYLYDPGHGTVLGAFTAETRQPNGKLAVQPVLGDTLVLEYVQPKGEPGRPTLRVGEVVHDYRGILDRVVLQDPQALLAGCLVDVNCPAGAEYQDIKRSVLFMLFSGSYCSAGLLNDTASDGTPYFLTANHCGDMTNGVAVFNFENTGCGPGGASQSQTISGATLLASSTFYDSQLYLLSAAPPANFQPFYAGWDRGSSQPGPAISISHPNGFPKKIARDDDGPILSGQDFRATWELGKLEPGSSGSPLFSGAKRVIGPACCVSAFTCNGQWAIYGRFGGFYDQRNLEQWLDPLGTDPAGIDGHDPNQGQSIAYNGSGVNPHVFRSLTPPTLGTTWMAEVDASVLPGTTTTILLGYRQPFGGLFVPQGELLVDVGFPLLFSSFAVPVNGKAVHSHALPNLASLIGFTSFTQAVLVTGSPRLLTNGIELRLR